MKKTFIKRAISSMLVFCAAFSAAACSGRTTESVKFIDELPQYEATRALDIDAWLGPKTADHALKDFADCGYNLYHLQQANFSTTGKLTSDEECSEWLDRIFQKSKEYGLNDTNAITMLFNSLWLALCRPAINLVTATMASYVMSKYKFPGRGLIWGIMLTTMVLPIYGSGSAGLILYKNLGFYDSPTILLASVTGLGGSIMIISAFDGVSKSYMEAAFVEGAGHFRVFWQIMVPQISGLISALFIMSFVGNWNDYMTSVTYLPSYLTLSTGLYLFQEFNARTLNVPLLFAGALLCMIPTTALYVIFQDKFMNLSFGGGIKG